MTDEEAKAIIRATWERNKARAPRADKYTLRTRTMLDVRADHGIGLSVSRNLFTEAVPEYRLKEHTNIDEAFAEARLALDTLATVLKTSTEGNPLGPENARTIEQYNSTLRSMQRYWRTAEGKGQ